MLRSDGPSADDPYFLYGASNLGSLVALLAFPLVAEPLLGAQRIGELWALGFLYFGALLLLCGLNAMRGASVRVKEKAAIAAPVTIGRTGGAHESGGVARAAATARLTRPTGRSQR